MYAALGWALGYKAIVVRFQASAPVLWGLFCVCVGGKEGMCGLCMCAYLCEHVLLVSL